MNKKGKIFNKATLSILSLGMIASMCSISINAIEADNVANWVTMYGDIGNNSITPDMINGAERLINGDIIAAGTFDGNKVTGVEQAKGKSDGAVILYDKNGLMKWETLVGGSAADSFNAVTETNDGSYVVVGVSQSDDGDLANLKKGGKDGLVAKLDSHGSLVKVVTVGGSDADELKDIKSTSDGGFIAVGYSHSTDLDMDSLNKTETDRDAVIVKFDRDLNVEWINRAGGTGGDKAVKKMDEFSSVVANYGDGSYLAVGYSNSSDGDIEGLDCGGKDAFMVKFNENGTKEWIKVLGGTGDDVFNHIIRAHNKKVSTDRTEITNSDIDNGYVLTGTTKSPNGIVENNNETNVAFTLKIDANGEVEWSSSLANSSGATGDYLLAISDGFLAVGTFNANDQDFTGTKTYGKEDIYIARYSKDGACLNILSYGGDGKDNPQGIIPGSNDDYIIYGNTNSNSGLFDGELKGKYDGFLASLDETVLEYYAEEKYLVPVEAWKADEDSLSMMAPLLYKDAYVEKVGFKYNVTIYFTNATIMGTQVSASTLGDVSYEKNGEMISALKDEYDEVTQIKTVMIEINDLNTPVNLHIEKTMGDIRLSFSSNDMVETANPPYFAPVEVEQPDFKTSWKINIGGSDYDYTNDMTTLKNGNIMVVGQSYSNDGDFKNQLKGGSIAYINQYNSSGELLKTVALGGSEYDSIAYGANVCALDDGFAVTGCYQEGFNIAPTGDFAQLNTEDTVHGQMDTFVAKYDFDSNLVWISNFSGNANDQVKQIKATDDGGVVVLIETNSNDGDMENQNRGLYDLVVAKYDGQGKKVWQRILGGRNIETSSSGLDILSDGSFIIGGSLSSKSGDFTDIDWYGDIFDCFAAKISKNGELLWTKAYGGDRNDYGNSVLATSDGGFILMGNTKSTTDTFAATGTGYDNAYVLKCNEAGETEWVNVIKSSETSEIVNAIELEDQYIFIGQSRGTDYDTTGLNKGSIDVFVANYDKSGNLTALENIGGSKAEYASKIMALNDYQISLLMYSESNDGDFNNMNYGKFDGMLMTYDYRQKPDNSINEEPKQDSEDNQNIVNVIETTDSSIKNSINTGDGSMIAGYGILGGTMLMVLLLTRKSIINKFKRSLFVK